MWLHRTRSHIPRALKINLTLGQSSHVLSLGPRAEEWTLR